MSHFTDQLRDFVDRLAKDGYPTAVVERAADRMDALEKEVIRLTKKQEDD